MNRYNQEHSSALATLSQLSNLRVELQDVKAEKAKVESDIKEMDKLYKKIIKKSKKDEIKYEETIKENEKLRIQYEG